MFCSVCVKNWKSCHFHFDWLVVSKFMTIKNWCRKYLSPLSVSLSSHSYSFQLIHSHFLFVLVAGLTSTR
jgi:hypothetical protein